MIIDNVLQCGEVGDGGPLCPEESANISYAFGVMRLDPQVDVRLVGPGSVSLELVRFYASGMSTQFRKNNFGRRFTSTIEERLEGNLSAPPSQVVWFMPGGAGVGHPTCTAQGSDYLCAPQADRHHELRRLSGGTWRLTDLDGTVTTFDSAGRMTGKHDGTSGWGYTVSYDAGGHAVSATDSAGRTLVFVHDAEWEFATGRDLIMRVELQRSPSNVVLAEYSYSLAQLDSVTRPTGTRTYEYDEDGVAIVAVRENSGATTIETHELDSTQRVIESHTPDAATGFRYDVECSTGGPPGVLLFDLTAPELDAGGDPKACTTDTQCSAGAACHAATCYWHSCAETDPEHMRRVTSITGNCECSGLAERSFTSGMRIAWETDRNGITTTYEHDSNGLVIAACVNDSDTTVTRAAPSTCPSTGRWTGTWYSSTYQGRPTEIRRSSVLSPGNWAKTEISYDANGRPDVVTESGYTRGSTDTIVAYSYQTDHDYEDSRLLANVTYDDADNRSTFKQYNGINDSYVYTASTDKLDRINHASQVTEYTLDGSGRRTYDDNTSLANDFRNYYYRADGRLRLVTGKRPSTSPNYHDYQLAYAYDHKGRRIFKSDKNVTTGVVHQWWFFYDQTDRLIGVRDVPNAASPTTYNVHVMYYLDGERVGRIVLKYVSGVFNQEQRDLFHDDHLRTPVALERWPTSGSSTIVWSAAYEAFGQANVTGGSTATVDLRYPGQWYDAETESRVWVSGVNTLKRPGVAQNWMREYDAWVGGYSSVEPAVARGVAVGPYGPQLVVAYTYAAADPASITDPRGLDFPWDDFTGVDLRALLEWWARRLDGPLIAVQPVVPLLCSFVEEKTAMFWSAGMLCPADESCWVYDCGSDGLRGWVTPVGEEPPIFVATGGPDNATMSCDPETGAMLN